jgi:hemin uptake protein HemP
MDAVTETTRPRPHPAPDQPRAVTSADLLQGGRKLLILHDGETYTLQLTRQNKLLLTK